MSAKKKGKSAITKQHHSMESLRSELSGCTDESTAAALRRACWSARVWAQNSEHQFARRVARILAAVLSVVERGAGDLTQAERWAREVLAPEMPRATWYLQRDTRDPFPERCSAMEQLRSESDFLLRRGVERSEIVDRLVGHVESVMPELAPLPKPGPRPSPPPLADCEALVREALRRAGMPAAKVRSVFNYRNQRAQRLGVGDD